MFRATLGVAPHIHPSSAGWLRLLQQCGAGSSFPRRCRRPRPRLGRATMPTVHQDVPTAMATGRLRSGCSTRGAWRSHSTKVLVDAHCASSISTAGAVSVTSELRSYMSRHRRRRLPRRHRCRRRHHFHHHQHRARSRKVHLALAGASIRTGARMEVALHHPWHGCAIFGQSKMATWARQAALHVKPTSAHGAA